VDIKSEDEGYMTSTPPAQIAFIDDDRELMNVYLEVLKLEGIPAIAFSDGEKALAALASIPSPKVLLVDFFMPGMNGEALFVKLMELFKGRNPMPAVYAYSALDRHSDLLTAIEPLVDGFVEKPTELGDFVKLVTELLTKDSST
jgi:CheY-like chemotaxis protein